MAAAEARLSRIEGALSPLEAVLAYLEEAHRYESLEAHVASLEGAGDEAYPLMRLSRQMEESVRKSLKGQPEKVVWPKVRIAVRDASFLYFLSANCNWRVVEKKRERWLLIALVTGELEHAVEDDEAAQFVHWWDETRDAVAEVLVQQETIQTISGRYFGGVSPVYPDIATVVNDQVEYLERTITGLNPPLVLFGEKQARRKKSTKPAPLTPNPIDVEEIRAAVREAVELESPQWRRTAPSAASAPPGRTQSSRPSRGVGAVRQSRGLGGRC